MSEGTPHEIIIIKRVGGGHEDEHHGGVWKIAFADFMTAMMAFFLVMWLISANDKTKAVIARYFNPVNLVDSTPQPKGLEDPKPGSPSVMPKNGYSPDARAKSERSENKQDGKADVKGAPDAKPETPEKAEKADKAEKAEKAEKAGKAKEAELFKDPYAVLAEIAGKADEQPVRDKSKAPNDGVKGGSGAVGIKGGGAYRDPFEPLPLPPGTAAGAPASDPAPTEAAAAQASPQPAPPTAPAPPAGAAPGKGAGETSALAAAESAPAPAEAHDKPSANLAAQIEAAVKAVGGKSPAAVPDIEVKHSAEGTLIDLTDGNAFAMFSSGSAEPAPKTVSLMERIGRILKEGKGLITIRGYTDNRPFRSDLYDNWRLSAARAHMAHYMLARGGVDEQRFERIEGYADRQPKNARDPGGPENRRIEILVRDAAP